MSIVYCSFCGKSQHEVDVIVEGPAVYICDECVTICVEIIERHEQPSDLLYPP